jgi:phytoene dehydrogenase-like protein
MKEYDIVIIGSGLGGLLSGAILSKEGFHVCVVEKNKVIGGNLQSFERDGVVFNTGLHYFGSGDKDQFIYKLFSYLGIYEKLRLKRLDIDRFDVINFRNKEYPLAQGFENFTQKLAEKFSKEALAIESFVSKIRQVGQSANYFNLQNYDPDEGAPVFNPLRSVNAYRFINSVTNNDDLRNVMAGLNDLLGGPKEKINMYILGMIYYTFIQSAWRFVDGSSQLAENLAEIITSNGGNVLTENRALEFKMADNKKIGSVRTSQNFEVFGKRFISDIHPFSTIELLPPDSLRKVYVNRLKSLENSIGMLTLYIVLKPNSFPYLNYNYTCGLTDNMWMSREPNNTWPHGYWFETPASRHSDEFARAVTILSPIGFEVFRKWEKTGSEKRGQEYEELKTTLAEKLLSKVFEQFPLLKSSMEKYYCSTPLTQIDYTGSPEGSAYGLIKDSEEPIKSHVLPKTGISNLFLTGQNTNAHGMLGVSTGALITLAHITDINDIIKNIRDAG